MQRGKSILSMAGQHGAARCLAAFMFAVVVASFAVGQTQPAPPAQPSFDAAAIKPVANANSGAGHWSLPGTGRFSARGLSVQYLIQMAYGVEADQIAGKPSWLDSDFYDVEAKPEEGIKLSRDELKPRLQNLLIDRFHLATHFETRMEGGYALVVAKGGPKLQPTKGDHFPGFRVSTGADHLEGLNWSMPILATMLQRVTGLKVADETGLAGSYDIKVRFASFQDSAPGADQDSSLPSVFTALRETLGLDLKPRQISAQVLMIDHIDRVPGPN